MKLNGLRRTISGAALTIAVMFGITIGLSSSAQAQYRDYNGRYDNGRIWLSAMVQRASQGLCPEARLSQCLHGSQQGEGQSLQAKL